MEKTMAKRIAVITAAATVMCTVPAFAADKTYTVTANLSVPGNLNKQLPGVTAYMTNGNNPLGLGGYEAVAPTTPVSNNATLTVTDSGELKLSLNVPNPVFTLQKIDGGTNAVVTDTKKDSEVYANLDQTASRTGRITDLEISLKDNSGTYVFNDCVEFPTLLGYDWTVPLTLEVAIPAEAKTTAAKPTTATDKTDKTETDFADVSASASYAKAVAYVKEKGLMTGTSKTTFSPNEGTTRGMLVSILYRYAGSPAVQAEGTQWYAAGRTWAMANGISDGTNMGGSVTHEQILSILYRNAGSPAVTGDEASTLADSAQIAAYAKPAVSWALENGIITNTTTLAPKAVTTRSEMASMLMNFCELQEG